MIDGYWLASADGDPRATALYRRHYSAKRYADGRRALKFTGPGEVMVLLTPDCRALWVWRVERYRRDGQAGVNCAIFRNEGSILSSLLVTEADRLAWARWPGERHFTFVDASKTRHKRDPGRCFRKAGWRPCGLTKGGLVILERLPEPMEAAA